MRNKIKFIIPALCAIFMLFSSQPIFAATTIEDSVCSGTGLNLSGGGTCLTETAGSEGKLNTLIATIVNIFSVIVGIVAVIMIIMGGFKYITSNGDSNSIQSAKNTILYAIVGIVIAAFAQVIVRFVLKRATNV